MASFVEQATLKVNDKSSAQINKINRNLAKLAKTAQNTKSAFANFKVGNAFAGSNRSADTFLSRLSTIEQRLRTIKGLAGSIRMRPPGAVPSVTPTGGQPSRRSGRGMVGFGFGGVGFGYGGLGLGGGLTAVGALHAGRAAGQETLALQAERSNLRILGQSEEEIAKLGDTAAEASKGLLSVTKAQALAATRNLSLAGVTGEGLGELTRVVAEGEAAITPMLGKEAARRTSERAVKFADLAGALDDPQRGAELLRGFFGAQLVGGADFNSDQLLTSLRTSGVAMAISADGLVNFAAAVEEQGRQAGSRLKRFNTILTQTAGVSEKQVKMLERSGVRQLARDNADLLARDYGEFIRTKLVPQLEAAGVDVDDAVAVRKGLQEFGFVSQELAFVEGEVLKRHERIRNRELASQVQFTKEMEIARKDLGRALNLMGTQFRNLSSRVLDPIFSALAPGAVGFAEAMNNLANGQFTAANLGGLAAAGAVGAVAFAASNPGIVAMLWAGRRLSGAATALKVAATRLSTAARMAPGGVTRSGRRRRVGLGTALAVGGGLTAFDVIGDMLSGKSFSEATTGRLSQLIGSTLGAGLGYALGSRIGLGVPGAALGGLIGGAAADAMAGNAPEIGAAIGKSAQSYMATAPDWVSRFANLLGVPGGQDELAKTPNIPTPRPTQPWDALGVPDGSHQPTSRTSAQAERLRNVTMQLGALEKEYNELTGLVGDAVAQRRADLFAEMQELKVQRNQLKAEGVPTPTVRPQRLPTGAEAPLPSPRPEPTIFNNMLQGMDDWLVRMRDAGVATGDELSSSIREGADQSSLKLQEGGALAGDNMANKIAQAGTLAGDAMAQRIQAAISNSTVNVRSPSLEPSVDTGAQVPN